MAARSKPKNNPAQLKAIKGFIADEQETHHQRLLGDRVRLGMLSSLAVSESLSFAELKQLLDATDGNLSVHARKLEEAKLVSCAKQFEGRVPKTTYAITEQGRGALNRYLKHMEALLKATR